MTDLSRKRTRELFKPRREAYWQRLSEGCYLGFRRGPDTWLARFRSREVDSKGRRKQLWHPLGEGLEYDEAKKRAEQWLGQLAGSAVRAVKRDTVRAALQTYLLDLRRHGRADTALEVENRFKVTVYDDPIASLALEDATQEDFEDWRDRLRKGRLPRSINRQVRAVVAGLNRAHRLGHMGNPSVWKLIALTDAVEESGETAVFLTPVQRAAIIAAASPATGLFLRAMELTGARPKEVANAKVSSFSDDTLRLAHKKGRPPKIRVRHVLHSKEGIAFFRKLTEKRAPTAWLLVDDDGNQWTGIAWSQAVRAAIDGHNASAEDDQKVPESASSYSFRHARISELLQVHGVDPLTVAAQTGTSLAMIEKHYLKFISSALREKLESAKDGP